jgi:hypothetical protein
MSDVKITEERWNAIFGNKESSDERKSEKSLDTTQPLAIVASNDCPADKPRKK